MAEVGFIPARQLGRQRLERFVQVQAELQAMLLFSQMTVSATPAIRYSDEAIDAMKSDAADVVAAAERYRDVIGELAEDWRAQRQEIE